MKKTISLLLIILKFNIVYSQNKSESQKAFDNNYFNFLQVISHFDQNYCIGKLSKMETSEDLTTNFYIYSNQKLNLQASIKLNQEQLKDTMHYLRTYRNGRVYIDNNYFDKNSKSGTPDDFVYYYNEVGQIIKRENRNFHSEGIEGSKQVKRSISYLYANEEIMEVISTIFIGNGDNIINPKKVISTVENHMKYKEKSVNKVTYEFRQRDIFKNQFGKITSSGIRSFEYLPNAQIISEMDTIGNLNYKKEIIYNPDSTIAVVKEFSYSEDALGKIKIEQTTTNKYNLSKTCIFINYSKLINGKKEMSSEIDKLNRTEKRYDENGKLYFETRLSGNGRDDEFKMIDKVTGQWTEWKNTIYCPIK